VSEKSYRFGKWSNIFFAAAKTPWITVQKTVRTKWEERFPLIYLVWLYLLLFYGFEDHHGQIVDWNEYYVFFCRGYGKNFRVARSTSFTGIATCCRMEEGCLVTSLSFWRKCRVQFRFEAINFIHWLLSFDLVHQRNTSSQVRKISKGCLTLSFETLAFPLLTRNCQDSLQKCHCSISVSSIT
jgi:hypothetical protein